MEMGLFILVFVLFIIPLGIFLRFIDLGLKIGYALKLVVKFPKEIMHIHYSIYKRFKKQDRKSAIKLLFAPITNLPEVIISYVEMHINFEAKILAITELLQELDEKEIKKMTRQLRSQGIKIKRRKVKQVNPVEGKEIKGYLGNLGLKKIAGLY